MGALSVISPRARRVQLERLAASRLSPAPATRALVEDDGWQIVRGDSPTTYNRTGREVRILGWERNPVVMACARLITDVVAAVDIEIFRTDADQSEILLNNHPAEELLQRPRVGMNGFQLRALTALHFVLYGNAFWLLERTSPTARPSSIRLIHPEQILYAYITEDLQEIVRYEWRDRLGVTHQSPAADVVHFKDISGNDWLFGYPRAAAALNDIAGDGEASQYVRQIVTNQGLPSLAVITDGVYSLDELAAAENRWHEKMTRRGGRGRTVFMSGVRDVKQVAFDMKNLEFSELRRVAREDICAAFMVDPRMVGIESAQRPSRGSLAGKEYQEARFRLIQTTVIPLMAAVAAVLDDWYCPEWGDVHARFSPEALADLTEDEDATSTRTVAELAGGVITREEARRRIGEEADMDPDDTLVLPSLLTVQKVSEAGAPTAAAPLAPGDSPPEALPPEAQPVAPAEPGPAPGRAMTRFLRGVTLTQPQRAALWHLADSAAARQEPPYRLAASLLFQAEGDGVRRTLLEHARARVPTLSRDDAEDVALAAAVRAVQDDYALDGDYYEAWMARFRALIAESFRVAAGAMAAEIGLSFDVANPRFAAAITARANFLAGEVTETTYEAIRAAVTAGRAAGMGIRDIADLIRSTVFDPAITSVRAERIARTETIGAMNHAELLSARESGVMRSKEWLTQEDALVRETHAAQDRLRIDLSATFPNGCAFPGDQQGGASEVINCRCTLLFSDEEARS